MAPLDILLLIATQLLGVFVALYLRRRQPKRSQLFPYHTEALLGDASRHSHSHSHRDHHKHEEEPEWDARRLTKLRRAGDHKADEIVSWIYATKPALAGTISAVDLYGLVLAESNRTKDSPSSSFISSMNTRPSWATDAVLARAQQALQQRMIWTMVLSPIVLCEIFCWADTAELIANIDSLTTTKEINAWLWKWSLTLWTVFKNGLAPSQPSSARSIELLAITRLQIALNCRRNRSRANLELGVYFSQAELAKLICVSANGFTRSFQLLGIGCDPEEENSIAAFLGHIGFLLGCEEEVLGETIERQRQLYRAFVVDIRCKPSTTSRRLVQGAVALTAAITCLPRALVGRIYRHFLGDVVSDLAGLPGLGFLSVFCLKLIVNGVSIYHSCRRRLVPWNLAGIDGLPSKFVIERGSKACC